MSHPRAWACRNADKSPLNRGEANFESRLKGRSGLGPAGAWTMDCVSSGLTKVILTAFASARSIVVAEYPRSPVASSGLPRCGFPRVPIPASSVCRDSSAQVTNGVYTKAGCIVNTKTANWFGESIPGGGNMVHNAESFPNAVCGNCGNVDVEIAPRGPAASLAN